VDKFDFESIVVMQTKNPLVGLNLLGEWMIRVHLVIDVLSLESILRIKFSGLSKIVFANKKTPGAIIPLGI
jgi:hypothetical protein